LFWLVAAFIREKRNPAKVPTRLKFFSGELWNQNSPNVLNNFGLGSMSLILLHHLPFQPDL